MDAGDETPIVSKPSGGESQSGLHGLIPENGLTQGKEWGIWSLFLQALQSLAKAHDGTVVAHFPLRVYADVSRAFQPQQHYVQCQRWGTVSGGMIAVLPAAGKGTRMSSVSTGSKELLPVGNKGVLQWVLDEAVAAGADRSVIVVSPGKPDLLAFVAACDKVDSIVQEVATGLAPAVVLAASIEPVLLLLPDTLFYPRSPSPRLVNAISRGFDIAIAVEPVAEQKVSQYGIVEWNPENGRIARIIEKPKPEQTASRWAITARFAISARTMMFVKQRVTDLRESGREIDLPPILNEAIAAGHTALAVPLEPGEQRLDCGNPAGYRQACEVVDARV